jgi:hypothetical protein
MGEFSTITDVMLPGKPEVIVMPDLEAPQGTVAVSDALQKIINDLTKVLADRTSPFRPSNLQLTMQVVVTASDKDGNDVKWWLLQMGGDSSHRAPVTQTITITFEVDGFAERPPPPRDTFGPEQRFADLISQGKGMVGRLQPHVGKSLEWRTSQPAHLQVSTREAAEWEEAAERRVSETYGSDAARRLRLFRELYRDDIQKGSAGDEVDLALTLIQRIVMLLEELEGARDGESRNAGGAGPFYPAD